MPRIATLCYTLLRFAVLGLDLPCYVRFAMLCGALPCFATLCHALLCFAMLCYALPCFAMLSACLPTSRTKHMPLDTLTTVVASCATNTFLGTRQSAHACQRRPTPAVHILSSWGRPASHLHRRAWHPKAAAMRTAYPHSRVKGSSDSSTHSVLQCVHVIPSD